MVALPAAVLLRVWEGAADRHPLDRALALLSAAFPDASVEQIAALPVGQRDALLLTLHARMFGAQLRGQGRCPACRTQAEFVMPVTQLLAGAPAGDRAAGPAEFALDSDDYSIRFRLPTSLDLAAVVLHQDTDKARWSLVERCVVDCRRGAELWAPNELPEDVLVRLGDEMERRDPLADVRLELACTQCQDRWTVTLDIVSFLWTEVAVRAKRLLNEVHLLARAYAWREADILSLSDQRRRFYLEMIS